MANEIPSATSRISSSLLCRSKVRQRILDRTKALRPGLADKKNRVSDSVFDMLEGEVRQFIDRKIQSMSSSGKTIQFD